MDQQTFPAKNTGEKLWTTQNGTEPSMTDKIKMYRKPLFEDNIRANFFVDVLYVLRTGPYKSAVKWGNVVTFFCT
jgi:hypothetical protein